MAALRREQVLPSKRQPRDYSGCECAPDRRTAMQERHDEHYQADVDEVTIRSIRQQDQGSAGA
jgi:hypothetical protein